MCEVTIFKIVIVFDIFSHQNYDPDTMNHPIFKGMIHKKLKVPVTYKGRQYVKKKCESISSMEAEKIF